MVASVR
jgi:putative intracellular protease/amidase